LSTEFKPDVFADSIIREESIPGGKRASKTRRLSGLVSHGRIDLERAIVLASSESSNGIYEDILPKMDCKGARIDDEEVEPIQISDEENRLWNHDLEETQELLEQMEAGEIVLPDDDEDDIPQS
jgi:hypothetical protein